MYYDSSQFRETLGLILSRVGRVTRPFLEWVQGVLTYFLDTEFNPLGLILS